MVFVTLSLAASFLLISSTECWNDMICISILGSNILWIKNTLNTANNLSPSNSKLLWYDKRCLCGLGFIKLSIIWCSYNRWFSRNIDGNLIKFNLNTAVKSESLNLKLEECASAYRLFLSSYVRRLNMNRKTSFWNSLWSCRLIDRSKVQRGVRILLSSWCIVCRRSVSIEFWANAN